MGAVIGLLCGVGLFLMWRSGPRRPPRRIRQRPGLNVRITELLTQAGIEAVTPAQLIVASAGCGLVVGAAVIIVSQSPPIALAFATFAAAAPVSMVRYRKRRRRNALRDLWPEVVDNLASGVRAGMALPEALAQIGQRGPEELRRPFQRFADDYRASGAFSSCLDRLKENLADPVGDRIVESLRIAREVGGTDLGRLLRTLSAFLREDARTRAELETRQGWTVNGARLAVAGPWILLALLSLNPQAVKAYNSGTGVVVLGIGAGISFAAYRLMMRIGRLPEEERVLR